MPQTASYVEFNISEPPIGHDRKRTISVYGFEEQRLGTREIRPLSFKGRVGETEGYGKPYEELFNGGSLTLGEEAALFNLYLLAQRGLVELPEPQRAYLTHKFDRIGYGNILHTVVDFDNGDASMPIKHDSDRRVLLIDRPELLVVENGRIKEVKAGEIDPKPKLWPGSGYVGRTCDGAYDPDGVPLETWETRGQAESRWIDAGADQDFAKDAVSYAWSRGEGQGKAIVGRRFFVRGSGRFDLYADGYPGDRDGGVGRSPVGR